MIRVLANKSEESTLQADAVGKKREAQIEFNEKTNHVPKRTIITVSMPSMKLGGRAIAAPDLPSLFHGRFTGYYGTDHSGGQFAYHWKCIGGKPSDFMDLRRLFRVCLPTAVETCQN
jgi:hypothetical protein